MAKQLEALRAPMSVDEIEAARGKVELDSVQPNHPERPCPSWRS